jgi:hypothetical protein
MLNRNQSLCKFRNLEDVKEIGCKGADRIHLSAIADTVINFRIPQMPEFLNRLSDYELLSYIPVPWRSISVN